MNLELIRLLLGALGAGDSLGSTSEFVLQNQIPALYAKVKHTGWPFAQAGGGAFNWRPGAMTDDGAMALAIVKSVVENGGRFDPEAVASGFVAWLNSHPPDIGATTRRTLAQLKRGVPWHEAGHQEYLSHPSGAANGSLMRNGVIPALADDLGAAFEYTVKQSMITHHAPLPVLCCALHTWMIWSLLEKRWPFERRDWMSAFERAWGDWLQDCDDPHVRQWRRRVGDDAYVAAWTALAETDFAPASFNPFGFASDGADGYCLLTLRIAVWALCRSIMPEPFPAPAGFPPEVFERRGGHVLSWVAMIGHDADTYAAVAGPLLVAAHGELPASMTAGLEVLTSFDALCR